MATKVHRVHPDNVGPKLIHKQPEGYKSRAQRRAEASRKPDDTGDRDRLVTRHNKAREQQKRARKRRGLPVRTPENMDRAGYLGATLVPVDQPEEGDDE